MARETECGKYGAEQILYLAHKTTKDATIRCFQQKVLHRIFPTRDLFHKRQIFSNNKCTFCRHSTETLEHFFVDCPYTYAAWIDIEALLSTALNRNIQLSAADKLLGSLKEDTFVNCVILLVKKACIL